MTAADILALASAGISAAAIILATVDKMPWVQKNKTLKTWIDDANDIAGELKLIIPMGSTKDQVVAAAEAKAAAIVTKYAGGVTQAEVVTQIVGEFARIIDSGHIVPPALQPAVSEVQALITKVEALIAAQPAPSVVPATPASPAPVAAAPAAALAQA